VTGQGTEGGQDDGGFGALPLLALPRAPRREFHWMVGLTCLNLPAPLNGVMGLW
jgi:hypothetical protein